MWNWSEWYEGETWNSSLARQNHQEAKCQHFDTLDQEMIQQVHHTYWGPSHLRLVAPSKLWSCSLNIGGHNFLYFDIPGVETSSLMSTARCQLAIRLIKVRARCNLHLLGTLRCLIKIILLPCNRWLRHIS